MGNDLLFWVVATLTFLAIPFALANQAGRSAAQAHVAKVLGLELQGGGFGGNPTLHGRIDGVTVRVEYRTSSSGKSRTAWTRIVATGAAVDLRFEAEGFRTGLLKVVTGEDYRTGDDELDDKVALRGDPTLLLALLDADTRRAVAHTVVLDRVVVSEGEVSLRRNGHLQDPKVVGMLLGQVVDLARRLSDEPASVPTKLARNARIDPLPEVRLRSLAALDAFHSGPAAAAVAKDARADEDARVRLLGARIRGDTEALRAAPPDVLRGLAPYDADRLVRALLRLGDASRIAALLDVEDAAVRTAALHALARIGTPDLVEAILPLTKGLFGDDTVRTAARTAVESIQARVGAGAAGRVTLVEREAGAVSLAGEAGRVSLPQKG